MLMSRLTEEVGISTCADSLLPSKMGPIVTPLVKFLNMLIATLAVSLAAIVFAVALLSAFYRSFLKPRSVHRGVEHFLLPLFRTLADDVKRGTKVHLEINLGAPRKQRGKTSNV